MSVSIPKSGTGIKASLVKPYNMTDIAWNNPQDVNFLKFSYLTGFCVQVGEHFYIRDKETLQWTKYATKESAKRALAQQRGGQVTLGAYTHIITGDDIRLFFAVGLVELSNTIYAPGCGDFVLYKKQKRLNIYKDHRLNGDTDHLSNTEEMLKIIRNSLCAESDEMDFAGMIDEINGPTKTAFKWVMHWLAARYQMPGFAPQTNLWFVGEKRGIGKGTLVQLMREILGGSTVGKAVQEDIAKGWTDCFLNKELMEWDEFKASDGWRQFNNLLKEKTGNDELTVNQRNVGVSTHPAVAMHIFSTNEERPILVEEHDRQNTFVLTTMSDEWANRSKAMFDQVSREFVNPNLASGFAALLNEIEIDVPFITTLFKTAKWHELRSGSEDSVKQFVTEGGADKYRSETKPNGRAVPWHDLHEHYRLWTRDHTNVKSDDIKEFKRKMLKHAYGEEAVTKFKQHDGSWKSARGCQLTLPDAPMDELAGSEVEPGNVVPFKQVAK